MALGHHQVKSLICSQMNGCLGSMRNIAQIVIQDLAALISDWGVGGRGRMGETVAPPQGLPHLPLEISDSFSGWKIATGEQGADAAYGWASELSLWAQGSGG